MKDGRGLVEGADVREEGKWAESMEGGEQDGTLGGNGEGF